MDQRSVPSRIPAGVTRARTRGHGTEVAPSFDPCQQALDSVYTLLRTIARRVAGRPAANTAGVGDATLTRGGSHAE
jgi:hypothetical protein